MRLNYFDQVSGWGYTLEYNKPSDMLRSLELPVIPREKCVNMLQDVDYREYLTQDKLCGGYLNKSKFAIFVHFQYRCITFGKILYNNGFFHFR